MYSNNIKPPNPDLSYYFYFRQTISHSAGKHDRPPYTPHTIYPLYYYTPFTVFQVLRLAKSSSAVIF